MPAGCLLKPHDLLETARILLDSNRKRPGEVSCRRAVSSCYYALFHCLAGQCADLLIGATGPARDSHAWFQTYRALEHGYAKSQCEAASGKGFPSAIEDFALAFRTMQTKRHEADYDPRAVFPRSTTMQDMTVVERAIATFLSAPEADRRAFCVWVLLKNRR